MFLLVSKNLYFHCRHSVRPHSKDNPRHVAVWTDPATFSTLHTKQWDHHDLPAAAQTASHPRWSLTTGARSNTNFWTICLSFTRRDGTDPNCECSAPPMAEEPRGAAAEDLLAHCCVTIFWSGTGWNSRRRASSISLWRKGSHKKSVTAFSRFTGLFWFAAGFKTNCKRNNYYGERKVVDYRRASLFCQIIGKLAAPLSFSCIADINNKNRSYNYFTPNSEHLFLWLCVFFLAWKSTEL